MSTFTTPDARGAQAHVRSLIGVLEGLDAELQACERWGRRLAERLLEGGRLLAAGNGGSAADAQHLTAELVGRFDGERIPLSAIALHAETSSVTAIGNDYGYDDVFARQVRAHGRPGDVFVAISTSGRSTNLLRAAEAARESGVVTWALTGAAPNPLWEVATDGIAVPSSDTPTIQEVHGILIHAVCAVIDGVVGDVLNDSPAIDLRDAHVTADPRSRA